MTWEYIRRYFCRHQPTKYESEMHCFIFCGKCGKRL